MLDAFRERLGLYDVPFLLGGLEDKNKLFVEKSSADAAIRTDLEHL